MHPYHFSFSQATIPAPNPMIWSSPLLLKTLASTPPAPDPSRHTFLGVLVLYYRWKTQGGIYLSPAGFPHRFLGGLCECTGPRLTPGLGSVFSCEGLGG